MDEAELQAEAARLEEELAKVYRELWPIREALAETRGPAVLPKPRYRTDKQNLIARCPRCGGPIKAQ